MIVIEGVHLFLFDGRRKFIPRSDQIIVKLKILTRLLL